MSYFSIDFSFLCSTARTIIKELLERNVGHIYAADCNEEQLKLTHSLFSEEVGLKHAFPLLLYR